MNRQPPAETHETEFLYLDDCRDRSDRHRKGSFKKAGLIGLLAAIAAYFLFAPFRYLANLLFIALGAVLLIPLIVLTIIWLALLSPLLLALGALLLICWAVW